MVRYKDCTTSLKVAQKDTLSSKEYAIRKKKKEKLTLKSQSGTRWVCTYTSVKAVMSQIAAVVETLIVLVDDRDPKTSQESYSLLIALCDFEFIFGLVTLHMILANTASLSAYLQGKDVDVVHAREAALGTKETFKKCRDDSSFQLVWEKANILSTEVEEVLQDKDTDVEFKEATEGRRKKPSRKQQARVGEDPSMETNVILTPKDTYRMNTYFPSLDTVIVELSSRFGEDEKDVDQNILCALARIVIKKSGSDDDFRILSDTYGQDINLLKADTFVFYNLTASDSLNTVQDVLRIVHDKKLHKMLPHFYRILCILATIPATSCTAERSFSTLRRTKTYLRNSIGQSRLSSLALLTIEREFTNKFVLQNIDSVIDSFGSQFGRNMYFF